MNFSKIELKNKGGQFLSHLPGLKADGFTLANVQGKKERKQKYSKKHDCVR